MKKIALPALLGAASTLALVSDASAASIDLTPVINAAIQDVAVPVLIAVAPAAAAVLVGVLTMPFRRFLDGKAATELAARVNDGLDKAIAAGAKVAEKAVAEKGPHVDVEGIVANVAADYAMRHFPGDLKSVGAKASVWAGAAAKAQAANLLDEKILARADAHPAVAGVKALAAATPVAKAA